MTDELNLAGSPRYTLWKRAWCVLAAAYAWPVISIGLLTDRQLMTRVRAKYGDAAEPIELDYRRDLFIAQAEVVLAASAIRALPLAALYGLGFAVARRRRSGAARAGEKPPPDDSRYRA